MRTEVNSLTIGAWKAVFFWILEVDNHLHLTLYSVNVKECHYDSQLLLNYISRSW